MVALRVLHPEIAVSFYLLLASVQGARTLEEGNFNYKVKESSGSNTLIDIPVTYKVDFTNLWTKENHPYDFPDGAHWSPIVVASHSDDFSLWCENDCIATEGVEEIAETGSPNMLEAELKAKENVDGSPVLAFVRGGGNGAGDGEVTGPTSHICIDKDHSLVSAITMIAPSPDWFTGMHDFKLANNGMWYEDITIYVYAWDAGTEQGEMYRFNNPDQNPKTGMVPFKSGNDENKVFVSRDGNGNLQVLPVAMLRFQLQGQTTTCSARSIEATPSMDTSFFVKVRKANLQRFVRKNCQSRWLAKRRSKRCRKLVFTRGQNGRSVKNGKRVKDFCPDACSGI